MVQFMVDFLIITIFQFIYQHVSPAKDTVDVGPGQAISLPLFLTFSLLKNGTVGMLLVLYCEAMLGQCKLVTCNFSSIFFWTASSCTSKDFFRHLQIFRKSPKCP